MHRTAIVIIGAALLAWLPLILIGLGVMAVLR